MTARKPLVVIAGQLKELPTGDSIDGASGLSAYQVAVNNGFVGTEADWLLSLKGADGTASSSPAAALAAAYQFGGL